MTAFFEFLGCWFLVGLVVALPLGEWLGQYSDASPALDTADYEPTPLSDFQEFSEGRNARG